MKVGASKLTAVATQMRQSNWGEMLKKLEGYISRPAPPGGRRRLYYPLRTFWLFLFQILRGNSSCRETVAQGLGLLAVTTGQTASPNTAAYCKARKRLSSDFLRQLHQDLSQRLKDQLKPEHLWHGRAVKILDGTGISLPDTPQNQSPFPPSPRTKPGGGFPLLRLVAVFSLATGALLNFAYGALPTAERTLFRRLWPELNPGDLILADRGFVGYADFWSLSQQGVDCVMRQKKERNKNSLNGGLKTINFSPGEKPDPARNGLSGKPGRPYRQKCSCAKSISPWRFQVFVPKNLRSSRHYLIPRLSPSRISRICTARDGRRKSSCEILKPL